MLLSNIIAIGSLFISVVSLVWIGGFKFSALIHEMKSMNIRMQKFENKLENLEEKMDNRFEKLENKIESLRIDLHKIDLRVTVIEQKQK